MKFSDAYYGVKKIYLAEILKLISSIAMFIAAAVIETAKTTGDIEAATETGNMGFMSGLVLAAGVLALIALIIEIIGVRRASWDEPSFKKALSWLFIGIVVNILQSGFQNWNELVASLMSILSVISELLVTIFVCRGIIILAETLRNKTVATLGRKTIRRLITVQIIGLIARLAALIGTALTSEADMAFSVLSVTALILSAAGSVISIAAYLIYLKTLRKGRDMLENHG